MGRKVLLFESKEFDFLRREMKIDIWGMFMKDFYRRIGNGGMLTWALMKHSRNQRASEHI